MSRSFQQQTIISMPRALLQQKLCGLHRVNVVNHPKGLEQNMETVVHILEVYADKMSDLLALRWLISRHKFATVSFVAEGIAAI